MSGRALWLRTNNERPRFRLTAALIALIVASGCNQGTIPLPAGLVQIAHPDLEKVENVARRQLEDERDRLDTKLARAKDKLELASAFGAMGELYHAYELLPAAIACYLNASSLDAESFLWAYYLGTALQEQGEFKAAAKHLNDAAIKRPDNLAVRLRLGEVHLAIGEAPAAKEHFNKLFSDSSFVAAAHYGLGRVAFASGDGEAAATHFEKALQSQPQAGIVHHSLGLALRQLNRMEEAQTHLEEKGSGEIQTPDRLIEKVEALAINSGAYLGRANRALVNGRLAEAVTAFRSAVAADPDSSEIRRNLALALMQQGNVEDAITELREAAETSPDDVWIHFDLGNAYQSKRLSEQAIDAFRRAVQLDPNLVSAHFNLANVLIGLERWDEAKPSLEVVLRLNPEESRAQYLSGMISHHTGDSRTAISKLRNLLEREPTNTVARQGLGTVLKAAGQDQQAFEVYRESLDLDLPAAEKIALIDPLAKLAWKLRHRELAVNYWQRATELDPTSSQAFMNLANALQLMGRRKDARNFFAQAVTLDPSNATAWLSEASLWILDKNFTRARERLEEALLQSPEHAGINHTLARLLATCPLSAVRDGRRSLALARKALGLENNLEHAETIGMALAELGQYEEAIRWQRGLLNQAAMSGERKSFNRLKSHLRIYESRQAVRVSGG